MDRIKLGISSCLLGNEVRYDGGHKRNAYIMGTLSHYFDFIPLCPETAIGLGVPRPPIHLVDHGEGIRVVGVNDPQQDVTAALEQFAMAKAAELGSQLSGFILKKGSPSCGMERVKVYGDNGHLRGKSSGRFAAVLMEQCPLLPVEEEGRLGDVDLRENFITRVQVYARWQQLTRNGPPSAAQLIEFHASHKYLVMAHNQTAYKRMGQMLANTGKGDLYTLSQAYAVELMQALKRPASRKQHINVLMHLMGYLKRSIDREDKEAFLQLLDQYREGIIPLVVPMTLLRHHFRHHPDPYVQQQVYLLARDEMLVQQIK